MSLPLKIDSLDDPRIGPYRMLKERELARDGGRFIAESEQIVRRLIASDLKVESVLLAQRRVEEIAPIVPPGLPVYVVADAMMRDVIGYKFHSGVIAVGVKPPLRTLDDTLPRDAQSLKLVICPETANTENLGGMIRIAAAFGVDAMILGEQSCDPFFRQSVRVSMGTVFRLPIIQSQNLLRDLDRLKREWNVELIAAVVDDANAAIPSDPLAEARASSRWALLFGNEAQGLSKSVIEGCDRRVTIPMKLGTDSLNVMVAAGIFLYHFTHR
jgi:tRNA G18 (ribose-2'-O)-methylase SpoU